MRSVSPSSVWLVPLAVCLAACGGDTLVSPSTAPTPIAPVEAKLVGGYTLSIRPDPICGQPAGPHLIAVTASSAGSSTKPELRVTLPGGNTTLTVEMLYEPTGHLRGSIGTIEPVPFQSGFELFVRGVGEADVSLAADGRGEILDGKMFGDVEVSNHGASFGLCTAPAHRFSLRAR
jgi:hypothetical protein